MNKKIAIIAPDLELYETATDVITENAIRGKVYDAEVFHAELQGAVKKAQELRANGVKIFISRGGTGQALASAGLHVPIIFMPISPADMLELMVEAKKKSDEIAVICMSDYMYASSAEANRILGAHSRLYKADTVEEIEVFVQQAVEDGAKVIIGSKRVVLCAERAGVDAMVIQTSPKVITAALDEATKMLSEWYYQSRMDSRNKELLDSIPQGIILLDEEGSLESVNLIAAEMFDLNNPTSREAFYQQVIKPILPMTDARHDGEVLEWKKERYIYQIRPYEIESKIAGSIICIQSFNRYQSMDNKARKNLAKSGLKASYHFDDILTENQNTLHCIDTCKKYSKLDSTILILGESGSGKELIAQSIHNESLRSNMPFVAINCAALQEDLLESELFGYVEGAFTGSKRGGHIGVFEMAQRGTLFLDEIGDISLKMQSKLLRVLEERQIIRVGGEQFIPIDVRIICATNRDLLELVQQGKFRSDLYYRINVLQVILPPLRGRKEDIPLLLKHFLLHFSKTMRLPMATLSAGALDLFVRYPWPGNIRELRNIAERIAVSCAGQNVSAAEADSVLSGYSRESIDVEPHVHADAGTSLRDHEKELILKTLDSFNGNKKKTCEALGISYSTLWRKLNQ